MATTWNIGSVQTHTTYADPDIGSEQFTAAAGGATVPVFVHHYTQAAGGK